MSAEFVFKDLYITPREYLELMMQVYEENSEARALKIDERAHPEDIGYEISSMVDCMTKLLPAYMDHVKRNARVREAFLSKEFAKIREEPLNMEES